MVKPSNRKPEHVKLKLISSFWWLWFSWSLFTFSMEKKKMIMFKQAKESAAVSANDILSISENKYWNYGLSTHHVCVKTFKFGWRNNITNMWTALRGALRKIFGFTWDFVPTGLTPDFWAAALWACLITSDFFEIFNFLLLRFLIFLKFYFWDF